MPARSTGNEDGGNPPKIRVWAQSEEANPAQYATMRKLAASLPAIEELCRRHGVSEADFVPPLARGSFTPDSDLHYEMYAPPGTTQLTEALERLREAILECLGLSGAVMLPLTPGGRTLLQGDRHLCVIAAVTVPEDEIYG